MSQSNSVVRTEKIILTGADGSKQGEVVICPDMMGPQQLRALGQRNTTEREKAG